LSCISLERSGEWGEICDNLVENLSEDKYSVICLCREIRATTVVVNESKLYFEGNEEGDFFSFFEYWRQFFPKSDFFYMFIFFNVGVLFILRYL
jgi:hypothetical protein